MTTEDDMAELRRRRAFGKLSAEEIQALDTVDRLLRELRAERIRQRAAEPQQSEPKSTSQKTRTPVQDRLLLAAHEAGEFGLPVGKDVSSRGCVVRYPAPAVDALERCGLVETFLGHTGGRWFKITKLGQSEATNLQSAA